jgi:hypothetical protein
VVDFPDIPQYSVYTIISDNNYQPRNIQMTYLPPLKYTDHISSDRQSSEVGRGNPEHCFECSRPLYVQSCTVRMDTCNRLRHPSAEVPAEDDMGFHHFCADCVREVPGDYVRVDVFPLPSLFETVVDWFTVNGVRGSREQVRAVLALIEELI